MNPFVGVVGGCFIVPPVAHFLAIKYYGPKAEKIEAEGERARKILADYKAENPLDDNPTQDTTAQAKLIRALDDELQDTKQRVAMLTFKMHAMGTRRPTPEPPQTWEPRKPKTYDVEPEIISPRPAPATTVHSDIAGDLYDDD